MLSDKDHLNYLDIRNNCIEQIDFKFIKHVYISLGIFNERCKFYGLTKTDIFFISKSTVYVVGTFVLVAFCVAIAMIILYSRRFTKSTKNDEMPMVVFNDLSNAVSDDNNRRLVEPPHEYEAINYIVPERRESNGYLVPRSDL
ncbi:PREDICTED: uncharacterized protein LOC108561591 [Nicrophorus vespilloides]|uniref:Uncharacterized protein LOC108561591 n=1 Tax=Nicrophorus vespilloides TaxID=110193 RepID=A0ABM1MKI9_NICVS|nr:PREDICTED: uncharacterized protein LOC108561591 [Nicrophorus vespilloides]